MAITTFLTQYEIDKCANVRDEALNKLYQEVKELSYGAILLQERVTEIKRPFRKSQYKTMYTLYNYLGRMDAQIINFHQYHDWSINTDVTASYIYAYLYGYFNGHHHGQGYASSKQNTKSQ